MSIILFVIIVLVVLALALYAVQLLPLQDPSGVIKPLIMVLCVVAAILAICGHAGLVRLG